MRIPLTKYGMPQVLITPLLLITAMLLCFWFFRRILPPTATISIEVVLFLILIWAFSFFRDPNRTVPADPNLFISPADGKITDIETVDDDFIEGKAIRIGIFLSVFNVHINRAPCAATVEKITYQPGQFKNAMNAGSARVNEANEIAMTRSSEPFNKLKVRQISGAIARRIVCATEKGESLSAGEKFGMIKFGSRTELFLPIRGDIEITAKIGDKVKAGLTVLAEYKKCQN